MNTSLSSSLPETNRSRSLLSSSITTFPTWWFILHLSGFMFLFTTGNVSLSSGIIEFPAAILTLSTIIILLLWLIINTSTTTCSTTTSTTTICSTHCLSKHFTLCLPFSCFVLFYDSLIFTIVLLLCSSWFLTELLLWRWFIRVFIFLSIIFNLPLSLSVKYLSLLYKHFLADLLMFLYGLLIELPPTSCTFYAITCILYFFFIIIIWVFRAKIVIGRFGFIIVIVISTINIIIVIFLIIIIISRFKTTTTYFITLLLI